MSDKIVAGILLLVGVVNLLPVIVFFDPSKAAQIYGVPVEGESLTILMRHRGVLLSLVGVALVAAAFKADFRVLAVALALISKFAFIFLTFGSAANYTPEIKQVALIDVGAVILLFLALGLHFYGKKFL